MFALFRDTAQSGRRTRDAVQGVRAERDSNYFTDGVNLYRIIDVLRTASGHPVVGLEDCRSLEVVLITAEEMRAIRLRRVRPAGAV
jgi:hypothetical protein